MSTRSTIGLPGAGSSFRKSLPAWSSPHAVGTGPIMGLLIIVGMILLLAALGGS